MALDYGIVPDKYKKELEERVVHNIAVEKDNHLWGGIFAVHSGYEYLPDNGYSELAYKLITEQTWPSFGWMVNQGATTLWEGFTEESSDIHHFMGAVDNYFYRHLAGINFDTQDPGFKNIVLKPKFVKGIEFVKAEYNSIHGLIKADWKLIDGDSYEYRVQIPANCKAELHLPDKKLSLSPGIHIISVNNINKGN